MSDPIVCPECRAGKCPGCNGDALDPVTDEIVPCQCTHRLGDDREEPLFP